MKYQSFIDLMNKGIISDKEINDFCEFPKEEQFDNLNFYIIGISILSINISLYPYTLTFAILVAFKSLQ